MILRTLVLVFPAVCVLTAALPDSGSRSEFQAADRGG